MKVKASFRDIKIIADVEPVNDGYFSLDFNGAYLMEIFYDGKEFSPTGRIMDGYGKSGVPFENSEVKIERIKK